MTLRTDHQYELSVRVLSEVFSLFEKKSKTHESLSTVEVQLIFNEALTLD